MIIFDLSKEVDLDSQVNAEEGLLTNAAIFAASYAAGKGISSVAKKTKDGYQNRKNIKEDVRQKELEEYYKTPEGRKHKEEMERAAKKEAQELNRYLAMSRNRRKSTEGFGYTSLDLAEEGILSKVFEKDSSKRESLKKSKYLEEFEEQKEALIGTTSKKIGELEGEDERLTALMKDDDTKCFNAIIKMHSALISLFSKQIEKLEEVQFENKDSIDELNEIFDKFNKDEKYEATMKLIKKEYPKSYDRANRIFNMSEDAYKKELKKHMTLTKLTESDGEDEAMESMIDGVMDDLIAEEGIISFIQTKFEISKAAKDEKAFNTLKTNLIFEKKKMIRNIDTFIKRVNKYKTDYNNQCFNQLISNMWKIRKLIENELQKIEAVEIKDRDFTTSLDSLKKIEREYFKESAKTMKEFHRLEGRYPSTFKMANKIADFENYWSNENSFDKEMQEMLKNEKGLNKEKDEFSIEQLKVICTNIVNDSYAFIKSFLSKKDIKDKYKEWYDNMEIHIPDIKKDLEDFTIDCGISQEVCFNTDIFEILLKKLRINLDEKYHDVIEKNNIYWDDKNTGFIWLMIDTKNAYDFFKKPKSIAEESIFNLGIAKVPNNDYREIYYTILSKDYNKSKRMLSQFFSGKKSYEIPNYILRNIVEIKNQFFPTIGKAINDALDTYERTKPLLNKERSFIYKKPEADRDAKIVQRFQANIDLLKRRKESYNLDTIDEFISSKTGNYEDHRYDEATIKVDANYLKSLLQVDETIKILKKLSEISKELPDLEEYSVLAKYSKEIAKYTNLEVFNSDDVKAPIHAYYNYITVFTLFMQFIEKTLISYVAAIYEVLNYTTVK